MMPPATIFLGLILPGLLVTAGLVLAWRLWNAQSTVDGRWIGGPLIGGAFALAFWHLRGKPMFPPGNGGVIFWIFYFAILLGLLGFADALFRPPAWLRAVLLVLLWRLAVRILLSPLIPQTISESAAEAWIDAACLAALIDWLSLETLAENNPGVTTPILLLILSVGAAALLTSWHITASATVAVGMAVICGAAAVASIWRRRISLGRGGVAAIILLLQALLLHGFFYTGDTLTTTEQTAFALFLFSPILAFAGDLPGICKMHRGMRLTARIFFVFIAVAAAAGLSMREAARMEQSQQTDQNL